MPFSLRVAPTVGPGGPWIAASPFGLLAMTVGMAHGSAVTLLLVVVFYFLRLLLIEAIGFGLGSALAFEHHDDPIGSPDVKTAGIIGDRFNVITRAVERDLSRRHDLDLGVWAKPAVQTERFDSRLLLSFRLDIDLMVNRFAQLDLESGHRDSLNLRFPSDRPKSTSKLCPSAEVSMS